MKFISLKELPLISAFPDFDFLGSSLLPECTCSCVCVWCHETELVWESSRVDRRMRSSQSDSEHASHSRRQQVRRGWPDCCEHTRGAALRRQSQHAAVRDVCEGRLADESRRINFLDTCAQVEEFAQHDACSDFFRKQHSFSAKWFCAVRRTTICRFQFMLLLSVLYVHFKYFTCVIQNTKQRFKFL